MKSKLFRRMITSEKLVCFWKKYSDEGNSVLSENKIQLKTIIIVIVLYQFRNRQANDRRIEVQNRPKGYVYPCALVLF